MPRTRMLLATTLRALTCASPALAQSWGYEQPYQPYSYQGQQLYQEYMQQPQGSYTSQRLGNVDHWTGPNGYSGTGQRFGNTYHYNDNQGTRMTCQQAFGITTCQ